MKKQTWRGYNLSGFILSLLALFVAGCSRPIPSSWSEQLAAAKGAVVKTGSGFVVKDVEFIWNSPHGEYINEPLEFIAKLRFINKTQSGVDEHGRPLYPLRQVRYNDLHLSSTLRVVDYDADTVEPPDLKRAELVDLVKISPQDVLKLTWADGQANNKGQPVTDDVYVELLIGANIIPPDINVPVVWAIRYTGEKELSIWIDAQTGEILKKSKCC